MMEAQRFILYAALGFVLLLLWQSWQEFSQPLTPTQFTGQPNTQTATTPGTPAVPAVADNGAVPGAPNVSSATGTALNTTTAGVVTPAVGSTQSVKSEGRIDVRTDLLHAQIDLFGGDIRIVELMNHAVSSKTPDIPFRLMNDEGFDLFTAQTGLIGNDRDYPDHQKTFTAERSSYDMAGNDTLDVVLSWTADDDVEYKKVFTFTRGKYVIDIRYDIDNNSDTDWNGFLYGQYLRTNVEAESEGGFFGRLPSYKGGAIYTPEDKYEKIDFDDMNEQPLSRTVDSGWVAMLQHYFVSAWLPDAGGSYRFYSKVTQTATGPRYNIGYNNMLPTTVAVGGQGSVATRLFAGPKEQKHLGEAAENLLLTVDYGWLTPVSQPLFVVLIWIHSVVGNWGWSIILLTMLIKAVFYPLSAASYRSMGKMKKLQPRLQTLKERYGGDKTKMNQAMMEMYKKEKVNPMGGCLPIVIQIPVFIALYWVLLESVELRQAPWLGWIKDLSIQDPYYILPLIMGASMFAQQLLNPQPLDPIQKNVMMAMPVVFTVFFLWFPAGLVLYWVVNNVLSIAQQWYITQNLNKT